MKNPTHPGVSILIKFALCIIVCAGPGCSNPQSSSYQEEFNLSKRTLVPTGRNDFFVLEPGFQLILESPTEKLAVTVLEETKVVDGITTRVVEEREWRNGKIIEISRNFFAIDDKTKDVFYFGEDVDMYKGEEVSSHDGAWLAGKNGARPGIVLPGKLKIGMRYYQEIAKGVAMDRAEVLKLDYELETPAGNFTNCLLTKEGSALNPFEGEFKTYAPGIGLIQDEKLLLTKYGFIDER